MSDDPKPDPVPDPTPNPSPDDGLTSDELKTLMAEVVDEKLAGFGGNFATKDDLTAFRTGIMEDLTAKIPSLIPAGSSVDESALLSKVGGMLDEKLRGIGGGKPARQPGSLGRWLLGNERPA